MKFSAILAFLFVPAAFAANPAKELLSKYESKDAGEKCEVRYEDDTLSIASLYQSRASYRRYVPIVEELAAGVIRLSYDDNDGMAEVFLIRKEHDLMVVATWEDGENGLDASSFCELEPSATLNLQHGQDAPVHSDRSQLR